VLDVSNLPYHIILTAALFLFCFISSCSSTAWLCLFCFKPPPPDSQGFHGPPGHPGGMGGPQGPVGGPPMGGNPYGPPK